MSIRPISGGHEPLDMDSVIAMERVRRVQALAPGESISFTDAPAATPMRLAQSATGLTDTAQSSADTATVNANIAATAADANAGTSPAGLLDLSATGGNGGATTLLAANDASASEGGDAAIVDLDDLANRWYWFKTTSSSYQNTVSFLDDWRSQWRVGRPGEIDMNGMKEYTAEWDKAHIGALEPHIEDYFTAEELDIIFSDSGLFSESYSADISAGDSDSGNIADDGAVDVDSDVRAEVGFDEATDHAAGNALDEYRADADPVANGLVTDNAGNAITEDDAVDQNVSALPDETAANNQEDGNRSDEGSFHGSEIRGWEAQWDARMRSYDEQYNALSTFRGSVSQGFLDYANEMTLANLQMPSWDDFVADLGLEDELALSDTFTDNVSADDGSESLIGSSDQSADETSAVGDLGGLVDQTIEELEDRDVEVGDDAVETGMTAETVTGGTDVETADDEDVVSSSDSDAGTAALTDVAVSTTTEGTTQRVVITGRNLPRDSLGNGLEIDAQGNAFVHLADGGGTIVLGSLSPELVAELAGPGLYTGSFLSRLATSDGIAVDDVLRLGMRLPSLAAIGTAVIEALPTVTASQIGMFVVGMVLPGNAINDGTHTVPMGENQRFVIRPGDLYGRIQERSSNGDWNSGPEARVYDIGGKFAILTDEQIAKLRDPMINQPESPGPGGSPGYMADGRDTSTPGFQAWDVLLPQTTTLPVTETSWRDTVMVKDGNASNNASLADQRYRSNQSLQDPSTLAGQPVSGIGTWAYPSTPRGNSGADFQEQQTGVPAGLELNVGGAITTTPNGLPRAEGGANFDGIRTESGTVVLVDTKDWPNYVMPDQKFWVDAVVNEARTQAFAAGQLGGNVVIEWQVSTTDAAEAIRTTLEQAGLDHTINVVHVSKKGP